jgi:hypothetical protein
MAKLVTPDNTLEGTEHHDSIARQMAQKLPEIYGPHSRFSRAQLEKEFPEVYGEPSTSPQTNAVMA